jgi:hypothetical protein
VIDRSDEPGTRASHPKPEQTGLNFDMVSINAKLCLVWPFSMIPALAVEYHNLEVGIKY